MAGTLYLCATPIGNLGDITDRVLSTLKEVDMIAAEDTRNSIKLLNHFEIKTPMTSYHEHNKVEKAQQIVSWLLEGKNIALITDAGTPAISDPGEVLVDKCLKAGIPVTSLPGCCACITALTLSGLSTRRFCFEGFLPADKKEKKYVRVVHRDGEDKVRMTLAEAYDRLTAADFVQIDRSCIAGLRHIMAVEKHKVRLRNGVYLDISQPQYAYVRKQISEYWSKK